MGATGIAIGSLGLAAVDLILTHGKKIVKWCGNCIESVVNWWSPHKEKVNNLALNEILVNQNTIMEADNPKAVGEIIAINREKYELDNISAQKYKNLSWNDRQRLDDLLDRRDY